MHSLWVHYLGRERNTIHPSVHKSVLLLVFGDGASPAGLAAAGPKLCGVIIHVGDWECADEILHCAVTSV